MLYVEWNILNPPHRLNPINITARKIPPIIAIPLTVFSALVSARLVTDNFNSQVQSAARPSTRQTQPEKFTLKYDPQCGIPAGGTFCDLDCERLGDVYKDPACLRDCSGFTKNGRDTHEGCYVPLVEDYIKHNGVCTGSFGQIELNWPESNANCQMDGGSVVHLDVEDFSEELLQCLLCHKEPARRIQSPLLRAFCMLLAGSL